MHPIEHLRYVARARGADPASLVRETAHALSSMRFDPSGLVVACRRIVERHPECGPLWWLCARLLTAADPFATAFTLADEIVDDPTPAVMTRALPDDATVVTVGWPDLAGAALMRRGDSHVLAVDARHEASGFVQRLERRDVPADVVPAEALATAVAQADVVVIEAMAVSATVLVASPGSLAAALIARHLGVPSWLVVGIGRSLPDDFLMAIADRLEGSDLDVVTLPAAGTLVDRLVRPDGIVAVGSLAADCPLAPELLRPSPF